MHKYLLLASILLANLAIANSNNIQVLNEYGLLNDLAYGQYGAVTTVKDVAQQNNFGIGAGVGLGELIILDGKFYIADPHGHLRIANNNEGLSCVTATWFKPKEQFIIKNFTSLAQLELILDSYITNQHEIYAIKLTGIFDKIEARSENLDKPPYTPIVPFMKVNQNIFYYDNKGGTIVMFRTPENLSQIQVKYHAHFVSNDKTIGGHIMNLAGKNIMVEIAPLTKVNIFLRTQFVPVKNLKGGTEANQFDSVVEAGSGSSKH